PLARADPPRQGDDGRVPGRLSGAEDPGHLEAGPVREPEVEQDERRRVDRTAFQRLCRIARLQDAIPRIFEEKAERVTEEGVVFDEHDGTLDRAHRRKASPRPGPPQARPRPVRALPPGAGGVAAWR